MTAVTSVSAKKKKTPNGLRMRADRKKPISQLYFISIFGLIF